MSQRKEDLSRPAKNAFINFECLCGHRSPEQSQDGGERQRRKRTGNQRGVCPPLPTFGCAVYPARVRTKDKALVENAVKPWYRSVYLDIEGMVSPSVIVNRPIHICFRIQREAEPAVNCRAVHVPSRGEGFFSAPALKEKLFVMKERKLMTVGKTEHYPCSAPLHAFPRIGQRVSSSTMPTQ